MAINWTEAQIEEVISAVIKNLNGGEPAPKTGYDGSQYNGRKYVKEGSFYVQDRT